MKSRLFVFVLAFVLILSLVPVVGAQSGECYGLSDADCQLMLDAEANSANMNAFNFSFDLDLSVDASAIGAMTGEADAAAKVAVKAAGTGAFMMADSADPMSSFALKMDMAGSANDGTGDQSFDFSFVIKDGMIYIMDPDSGQWMGMSMEDAMAMSDLPIDPSAMLSGGRSQRIAWRYGRRYGPGRYGYGAIRYPAAPGRRVDDGADHVSLPDHRRSGSHVERPRGSAGDHLRLDYGEWHERR